MRWALCLALVAACHRPIHRRTHVFEQPGARPYQHPAELSAEALEPILVGRIHRADLPGMAAALSRTFRRLGPRDVIHYRHPDGGAVVMYVLGDALVVKATGEPIATYALADLELGTRAIRPPKRVEVGEITPLDGVGAGGDAELEVSALIALAQYVFVDGKFVGAVPPGETRTFVIRPGRVRVVIADGDDGRANAVTVEVEVQGGTRRAVAVTPVL